MIIRNMRWGYDGGGTTSGPEEGTYVVEIAVADEKGRLFFAGESRSAEGDYVLVSPVPFFDLITLAKDPSVDTDLEYEKVKENITEHHEIKEGQYPEELLKSSYHNVYKLALQAMDLCHAMKEPDYESAQSFIREYVGTDVDTF